MQLPFTFVLEPPRWARRQSIVRRWWVWTIAVGLMGTLGVAVAIILGKSPVVDQSGSATLQVVSEPPGATIEIDGRGRGRTPGSLSLGPGDHRVRLRLDRHADATYQVNLEAGQETTLEAALWLRTPRVQQIRPTFPGAVIDQVTFLADGRVALLIAMPPGDERQLWLLDGQGGTRRLGPAQANGSLAVTSDGERVAYLAHGQKAGPSDGRLTEVWTSTSVGEAATRLYTLPPGTEAEHLIDLSWAPDRRHLLVVSREQVPGGGHRTHLRRLDTVEGSSRDLLSLPSEIVPGSYSWSPDGQWVAFLSRAGSVTSLCLLGLSDSAFHYLADLSRDDPNPLPFPPVAWSADGRSLIYAAPPEARPGHGGWLFGLRAAPALFTADLPQPVSRRLGEAEGQSPAWRGDGSIFAFARPKTTGPLVLRSVTSKGETADVAELPLKPGSDYAVRWDADHAQAVIALDRTGSLGATQPEYWLARFRDEGASPQARPEAAR